MIGIEKIYIMWRGLRPGVFFSSPWWGNYQGRNVKTLASACVFRRCLPLIMPSVEAAWPLTRLFNSASLKAVLATWRKE